MWDEDDFQFSSAMVHDIALSLLVPHVFHPSEMRLPQALAKRDGTALAVLIHRARYGVNVAFSFGAEPWE